MFSPSEVKKIREERLEGVGGVPLTLFFLKAPCFYFTTGGENWRLLDTDEGLVEERSGREIQEEKERWAD